MKDALRGKSDTPIQLPMEAEEQELPDSLPTEDESSDHEPSGDETTDSDHEFTGFEETTGNGLDDEEVTILNKGISQRVLRRGQKL
jgi:hypothetical protein